MSYIHEWNFMKGCPYEVLDHAITHAIQARDEVICRNNELNSNKHHLHFQKKKNHNWLNLEGKVEMDSKLIFNRKLEYWTFVWVYGKNIENCNDIQVAKNLNIIAIDPGVRTGWSWYSLSKGCGWFGNLDISHVFCLSLSLDDRISR
ncbi:44656_t:CDS:2, partial [Gigaspora margarita]